ncbi:GRB10-interacting GYF protein 2-like [Anopheles nili]|uniref:GRB10-interacting GYF protein 2-like n=1 Tax=Anopheles nili TaxID=185578 RepID=UPI00237C1265|nr:GRB10-interacting GYF protein 2-like [Anopheles nili]
MNGFFQINTYYNEFKQEPDAAYVATPIQHQQDQQQQSLQQPTNAVRDGGVSTDPSSLNRLIKPSDLTKNQRRFLNESEEAREKRLARNAERMRQKRASETEEQSRKRMAENAERMRKKRAAETEEEYQSRMERNAMFKLSDEYRRRLSENAERNRRRRQNESELERSIRRARSAARERLRRAMESPEQRAVRLAKLAERMRITRERLWSTIETPEQRTERLAKLAERMRIARANETPEQRAIRLAKNAARARQRFLNESPEQWIERKRKKAEYARQKRAAAASIGSATISPTTTTISHGSCLQHAAMDSSHFPSHTPTTLPEMLLHSSVPQSTNAGSSTFLVNSKDGGKSGMSSKTMIPSGPVQVQPEQIYTTPQVVFSSGDFKQHQLLNGQHLVMQSVPNCSGALYKLLPYPFPTSTASTPVVTQLDNSSAFKSKQL